MPEPLEAEIVLNIKKLSQGLAAAEARFSSATRRFEEDSRRANRRLSDSLGESAAGFQRLGQITGAQRFVLQNTSAQLGDIAVQLQAGTAPSRVMAQQLPQVLGGFSALGGTLGIVGPLLGTIAAVGIPVGVALAAMGAGAEDTALKLDKIEALSLDKARAEIESLKDLQNQLNEAVLAFATNQNATTASNLINLSKEYEARKAILELEAVATENRLAALRKKQEEQQAELRRELLDVSAYAAELAKLNEEQREFGRAFDEGPFGVTASDIELADLLAEVRAENDELIRSIKQTEAEIAVAEIAVQNLEAALTEASEVAAAFSGIDMSGGIASAVSVASALVERLGVALNIKKQIAAAGDVEGDFATQNLANQYALYGQGRVAGEQLARDRGVRGDGTFFPTRGGGGGGGSGALESQLEALRNSLLTQEELQLASFQKQQTLLQEALAARLLTQQDYNEQMERLQRDHAEKMSAIDVYRYGTTLDKTDAFLGSMAQAFSQGNDEMLRISKAFGAAQALISAWQGAAEALKLPFPANLAAFAQVLATGMGAVSAIKSVGKGGTGGGSSGAVASTGASTAPNDTFLRVSATGLPMSSEQMGRYLVDVINEATRNGARLRGARFV